MQRQIQRFYICIINIICACSEKLGGKIRWCLFNVALFVLLCSSYYGEAMDLIKLPILAVLCSIQAVCLFVMVMMSPNKQINILQWNKRYVVCWYCLAILMIVASIHHNTRYGFVGMGLMMLTVYPILFLVWNNSGNYEKIFDAVARLSMITAFFFFVLCVMYDPLSDAVVRYMGFTHNPGSLGKVSIAALTCGLYLLCREKKIYWLYAILCGIMSSLVFLSGSRTAIVAMIVEYLFFFIFCIKKIALTQVKKIILVIKLIIICLLIVAMVPVSSWILKNGSKVTEISRQGNIAYAATIDTNSESEADIREENQRVDLLKSRFSLNGKSLNEFLSERGSIYKVELHNLNLLGHDMTKPAVVIGTTEIYHSHNTALEFAYRCGAPAGVCFLIIEMLSAIYIFKVIFNRKTNENYQYFVVFAVAGFGIMSLADLIYNPAADPGMFYFFLALAPLFKKVIKGKDVIKER